MQFAFCNETFEDWAFGDVCAALGKVGYDGVEVAPFTLAPRAEDISSQRCAELRATATEHGLTIVGLHWLLAKTEGLHLTSNEPEVRAATSAYLGELARVCAGLGGEVMVFGSPPQRSLPSGVTPEQGFDFAVDVFRDAMPRIAEFGVQLLIEPLAPVETDFINTCADGRRLAAAVDHPHFGLHLDVKAMCSEDRPLTELIGEYGTEARHFHANDRNLRGPGTGDIDFVPLLAALHASGYGGWASVEVFDYQPDAVTIARESIAYLRKCVGATA